MSNKPNVGTAAIIVRDGKFLAGKRKGSHAAGCMSFPGGSLEFGEDWIESALREISEECGNDISVEFVSFSDRPEILVTNDYMPNYNKHYITIFLVFRYKSGEAINVEPHKCEGWDWFSLEELSEFEENQNIADWIPIEKLKQHEDFLISL